MHPLGHAMDGVQIASPGPAMEPTGQVLIYGTYLKQVRSTYSRYPTAQNLAWNHAGTSTTLCNEAIREEAMRMPDWS